MRLHPLRKDCIYFELKLNQLRTRFKSKEHNPAIEEFKAPWSQNKRLKREIFHAVLNDLLFVLRSFSNKENRLMIVMRVFPTLRCFLNRQKEFMNLVFYFSRNIKSKEQAHALVSPI